MSAFPDRVCPGCGLKMPVSGSAAYDGYYNASPECWSVYTEVLGSEYSNPLLFVQVHQLTVDTYAVQHTGGPHPDKSIAIHLSGLHLVHDRGLPPPSVPRLLKQLADAAPVWPHFPPPAIRESLTVFDVALAGSDLEHIDLVRHWSAQMWDAWRDHHPAVVELVRSYLRLDRPDDV